MYLGYTDDIKENSNALSAIYEDDFLAIIKDPENIDAGELACLAYRLIKDYQRRTALEAETSRENKELRDENRHLKAEIFLMEAEIASLKMDSLELKERKRYEREQETAPDRTRSYANVGPKAKNDYSVIINMHKEGVNNNQIAQQLGTTRQNIGRILKMWKEGKINV